jgi:WD40 repeat protein
VLYKLEADKRRFTFIHFSPDGKKIIGGWVPEFPSSKGRDSTIQIWDANSGKPLYKISPYQIWISDANFTPDGKRILVISATNNEKVLLCDAENGKPVGQWQGLTPWSGNVQFSSDGTKTVICGDSTASVIEVATGKHLADIGLPGELGTAQLSYDGKKIAVILKDGNAGVWDIEKGIKVFNLTGHTDAINTLQFNPDNKTLITTSKDNTAKVWNANSGKPLYTFFSIDSSDYFNLLLSGYYKGTGNASKLLHYVTNGLSAISFEQLDVKYNRPDKVLEAMSDADTSLVKSYRLAYEKRIKKLGIDTASFLDGYNGNYSVRSKKPTVTPYG